MISETALKRLCKPVVLRRAQRIALQEGAISKRRYRYDEGETLLRARVDSASSWDEAHRTSVALDEEADTVVFGECDCHMAREGGMCDHMIALVMDFNDNPEAYEGYDTHDRMLTSRSILRAIELAQGSAALPNRGPGTEAAGGTVRLEATLAYGTGFDVRFRIAGSQGSYALKSIADFVAAVEAGDFCSYGQRLAFEHVSRAFTPQAQRVVEFLLHAVQNRRAYAFERVAGRGGLALGGQGAGTLQRELHLSAPEVWDLLYLYEATGITFEDRSLAQTQAEPRALRIAEKDPDIRMDVRALPDGGFELVRRGFVRMVSVGRRALAWDATTLYRCSARLSAAMPLLAPLLSDAAQTLQMAADDAPAFCAQVLPQLEEAVGVHTCPELDELRPHPCELRFYLDYDKRSHTVTCDAQAVYGEVVLNLLSTRATGAEALLRDLRAEARGREAVRRLFSVHDGHATARLGTEELGALVYEGVPHLQEVGTVFAYPGFERLRSEARPRVQVGLSVKSNLLNLSLLLKGLPARELAGLLRSYRTNKSYHQLRDGSIVRLEDADLAVAGQVADELELDTAQVGKAVVVPAYKASVLDVLVSGDDKDESFTSYLDGLRGMGAATYEPPTSLAQVLRPYQVEGFRWLSRLADLGLGGILADEMGLGKSVQLISFLLARADDARGTGPSLVVCPSSLVYNWLSEFCKFAPELSVRVVAGTPQDRADIIGDAAADVLITSYDLLRRDLAAYEGRTLWCVALDEAQYIKNPATHTAQAVKALVARNRVALTGTPVENRLSELWSIFDFLMPGLLGSYERFRERYERPIVEDEAPEAARRLRDALRPFILRRQKRDVASDLPEKIEEVVRARMGEEQRLLYGAQVQEVRDQVQASSADDFGAGKFQILALLTRLRQICCDPRLLYEDYDAPSAKTDTIMTLVERVTDAGEKLLLFSQFTSYLDVLSQELDRRGIAHYTITGATPSARRVDLVDRFNQDDVPVFLISLKAGGTGLNLTGATVVIHADPWWNAAAQNQATDRAHRIGQTRQVTVYKVIASDSIEERILDLQRTKTELADAVVQGDVSSVSLASLTREDLEDLLS